MTAKFIVVMAVLLALSSPAAPLDRIRIAVSNPNMPNLTVATAQKQGFFKDENLDAEIIRMNPNVAITALAIARMIVRGVFERFAEMKFVGCHLGGGICEVIGRMDYAYELGDRASGLGSYEPMLITKRPSDYLRRLYMDTVAYHPAAVMCAYHTVGAKRLLFGSDAPPLLPLLPRAKKIIEELPLTEEERADIFGRNALMLLDNG